jgi:hypothetical protein
MKAKQTLQTTTNSRTYKLVMRGIYFGCPICGPHSGCNSNFNKQRNWKKFRKTKYKMKRKRIS